MVLQLLAATEKTGQLEVRAADEGRGLLGLRGGRLVSAQYDDEDGYLALGALFAIDRGDFEFLPQDSLERADLAGDLEQLLERAGVERERVAGIREVIPTDRIRFRLSERATERGEITLAPAQWKALLLVDGERDVASIAERLEMRRLSAAQLLASLVRAGLVDPVAAADDARGEEPQRAYRRLPPMAPIPPTTAGEQVTLRGRLPDFPLETIVQLLAETKKTGRLEVRAGRDSSTLGMADGRLVSARWGEEEGEIGLGAAFTAREGEFDFVPMDEAPAADLSGDLDPLLDRAADIRDRIAAIRGLIPNDRSRFTLSDRATRNAEIVLTPEQWRVLLGVNGERDVAQVADHLRMRQLPTLMVLADLVRGGYVDVLPPAEQAWPYVERRRTPWPAAAATPVPAETAVPVEPEAPAAPWGEPVEEPLAETPLDVAPEGELAPIEGLVGAAEPAPSPSVWEPAPEPAPEPPAEPSPEAALAEATAAALAEAPAAEPEIETPPWEAPSWEQPAAAEAPPPAEEEAAPEIDPRLAAFSVPPPAEPQAPSWEPPAAPAWEAPAWEAPAPEAPAPEAPAAELEPEREAAAAMPEVEAPPAAPYVPPVPEKKKGGLFGGLFGGAKEAPSAAAPVPHAGTRAGQLASFANELVAAYNSGQYGKARVEDRMLSLLMRADEQADPIDRPLPIANDRLDVGAIDRAAVPERQALPYLALLVREIFDEAERALGKDKARRGFRDVRDRLFGRDLALLHAPEVSGRLPKV